jgi:hypothetical protein
LSELIMKFTLKGRSILLVALVAISLTVSVSSFAGGHGRSDPVTQSAQTNATQFVTNTTEAYTTQTQTYASPACDPDIYPNCNAPPGVFPGFAYIFGYQGTFEAANGCWYWLYNLPKLPSNLDRVWVTIYGYASLYPPGSDMAEGSYAGACPDSYLWVVSIVIVQVNGT